MSILTKLLPVAALGAVGVMNSDALKNNIGLIQKAKVAATSGIEMRALADAVAMSYTDSKRLPLLNFAAFLKENMMEKGGGNTRDPSKDMWGTPYRITIDQQQNGFNIWSAGPDKFWTNEDDLMYLYVLTGIGGKNAISDAQMNEWQRLAAGYRAQNARQSKDDGGDGGSLTLQAESSSKAQKKGPSPADRKKFESQKRRAEDGSATAKLQLAERFLKGDAFVEKDLQQAKKLLEESMGGLDSQTYQNKAQDLLDQVNLQLK